MKRLSFARGLTAILLVVILASGCTESSWMFSSEPLKETPHLGEWVKGHYWSLQVVDVQTTTELDGHHPREDVFVIVDVNWQANNLAELHHMDGMDYELIDDAGHQYKLAGMIFQLGTYDSAESNAAFQEDKWKYNRVKTGGDMYALVYDVPISATGLKLWFQDFPLIDLEQ